MLLHRAHYAYRERLVQRRELRGALGTFFKVLQE